ncbi:hypothetical protein JCM14108_1167 [Lentilactobacillus farraginis DSM 18382 = JCM 14108]|uniref:Uncharacterized protein n=1 Tax=Lentilactobacillus farraginis DSM 18382 = JCM 14108 TaxID=1423743 RepID=X0PGU8_9LACO|nr:hypothetical protein JCM14108_1167 [Lentilactobacillus farraginis DSM 18382 = JCM 14108]
MLTIGVAIYDCITQNYTALLPMYTHNSPQGLFSWLIFLTLVPFGISRMYRHPDKKTKH